MFIVAFCAGFFPVSNTSSLSSDNLGLLLSTLTQNGGAGGGRKKEGYDIKLIS